MSGTEANMRALSVLLSLLMLCSSRLVQLAPYTTDAILLSIVYLNRLTHLKSPPGSTIHFSALLPHCAPKRSIIQTSALTSTDPAPPLTEWTAHRLVLAALGVAALYTSDGYIAPVRASKVAGVPAKEIHALELEMFIKLGFDCVVRPAELESVCRAIWLSTDQGKREQEEEVRGSLASLKLESPNDQLTPPLSEDGESETSSSYFSSDASEVASTSFSILDRATPLSKGIKEHNITYGPSAVTPTQSRIGLIPF